MTPNKREKVERLSLAADHEFVRRARAGDPAARDALVRRNLGIVGREAKKMRSRWHEFDDLFQEGVCGILAAIERFTFAKKVRFSTYATFWVRAKMLLMIKGGGNKPCGALNGKQKAFFRAERSLEARGLEPTDERMVSALGVSLKDVQLFRDFYALKQPAFLSSFERDLGEGGTFNVLEHRMISPSESPEDTVIREQEFEARSRALRDGLRRLDSRSRKVIERHLLAEDPETLGEIGKDMRRSRERIRQIEEAALARVRRTVLARYA